MAFDNTMTVIGNLTRDPELRFTPSGAAVANFGIAWNMKGKDGQEDRVSFFDVVCWRQLAENVSDSLVKGSRVVVHGRLDQRSWQNQEGEKRSKVELVADDVAPSLKWATAQIAQNERANNGGQPQGGGQQHQTAPQTQGGGYANQQQQPAAGPPPAAAPPAAAPEYQMNEEPF